MAKGQRRFVLAVGLAAAAALGGTVYLEWRWLRNEWWRWRAIRDVRAAAFDPKKAPPASWSRIVAAGEEGYPVLAKLLGDRDPQVWGYAFKVCDEGRASRLSILATDSQDNGQAPAAGISPAAVNPPRARRALVRTLPEGPDFEDPAPGSAPDSSGPPPAIDQSLSARSPPQPTGGSPVARSATLRDPLLEFLQRHDSLAAVRFLLPAGGPDDRWRTPSSVLLGDSEWYRYWCGPDADHLEPSREAVDLLEACVLRKESPHRTLGGLAAMLRPGEVDHPPSPLAARIVKILALAGREDSSLEALRLLAYRSAAKEDDRGPYRIPFECDWTLCLQGIPRGRSYADFTRRESLLALCHFDHAWSLRVITRLLRIPEVRPALEAILAERPRLGPLELPVWRPPFDAARRFLGRSGLQRSEAAAVIAEEGLQEGAPLIREVLAVENRVDLADFYRTCLLALGDETQRQAVRDLFTEAETRKESSAAGSIVPVLESDEFHLFFEDIARNLILSGDRVALEWLVLKPPRTSLRREDFVDGIPWDGDLLEWWATNQSRLDFDPARRKFFLR